MNSLLKISLGFLLVILGSCSPQTGKNKSSASEKINIHESFSFAEKRLTMPVPANTEVNRYPRSVKKDGSLHLVRPQDWTSGFYPGNLWLVYEYSGNEAIKKQAIEYTEGLEQLKTYPRTHDLGFMMFCSYGQGYRLTNNPEYKDILLQTAETLTNRFDPTIGCIKSWDWKGQYPVIIDNMMNLELLFWAANVSGNEKYYDVAVKHAETTMNNHFRPDNSSYHVVVYDTISGKAISKQTHQGTADESSWARGQAWGLYGYTMVYRETGQKRFLDQAIKIADFYLNHPTLPKDMVPYWDFDAPGIPNAPRDVSAAAITSSALLELTGFVSPDKKERYLNAALKMLKSLSSSAYIASEQTPAPFILQHSVGHKPKESEVDVPIIYADYYYLESLSRYKNLFSKKEVKAEPMPDVPKVFTMDGASLVAVKENIKNYEPALAVLKKEADECLMKGPYTITNKTSLPPSGSKHDYESQGPYWWPNPNTPNGLPYIRKDGEKNPEIQNIKDHDMMLEMIKAVKKLSLAYYYTGNETYANHAALLIRTWFINKDTRMNPNLNYGQRIPGITDGRDIGIIDSRFMGEVADAVGLLKGAKAWSESDQAGIENWCRRYLTWLLHSKNGTGERKQHNNHGSWYDVQVAALALFVGEEDIAKETLLRARDERLPKHIEPDGKQPHELARTHSWGYSVMNLQSFFTLATLGEKAGIDLWNYSTADGRSLQKALDYLAVYASEKNVWPHKEIGKFNGAQLIPLLSQASCKYHNNDYASLAEELSKGNPGIDMLLYGCKTSAK